VHAIARGNRLVEHFVHTEPAFAMRKRKNAAALPGVSSGDALNEMERLAGQTLPLLVHTQAAPAKLLSAFPPTMAVLPSPESDTAMPCSAAPTAPAPTSFGPCCVHVEPERVKTQAAPTSPPSPGPPISAVFPSADSATAAPASPAPVSSPPVSFEPCCRKGSIRSGKRAPRASTWISTRPPSSVRLLGSLRPEASVVKSPA